MLALTPAGQDPPVLHILETNLGGNGFPRLEVLGFDVASNHFVVPAKAGTWRGGGRAGS